MADFNRIIHSGLPKMMQVADDMHRMTDYIMDLRNMTFGLVILSVMGALIFLYLNWKNKKSSSRRNRQQMQLNYALNPPHHNTPDEKGYPYTAVDMDISKVSTTPKIHDV